MSLLHTTKFNCYIIEEYQPICYESLGNMADESNIITFFVLYIIVVFKHARNNRATPQVSVNYAKLGFVTLFTGPNVKKISAIQVLFVATEEMLLKKS